MHISVVIVMMSLIFVVGDHLIHLMVVLLIKKSCCSLTLLESRVISVRTCLK